MLASQHSWAEAQTKTPSEDRPIKEGVGGDSRRRSRLDICFDIMDSIWDNGELKPTQLMYKANLSWKVATDLTKYLISRGLVSSRPSGSRQIITLTPQGKDCLRRLHEARDALVPSEDEAKAFDEGPRRLFGPSNQEENE